MKVPKCIIDKYNVSLRRYGADDRETLYLLKTIEYYKNATSDPDADDPMEPDDDDSK